jgi:hypothetical protein
MGSPCMGLNNSSIAHGIIQPKYLDVILFPTKEMNENLSSLPLYWC